MTAIKKGPGANTQAELLSQPSCWKECFAALDNSGELETLGQGFREMRSTCSLVAGRVTTFHWRRPRAGKRSRERQRAPYRLPRCCFFRIWF